MVVVAEVDIICFIDNFVGTRYYAMHQNKLRIAHT